MVQGLGNEGTGIEVAESSEVLLKNTDYASVMSTSSAPSPVPSI